MEKIDLKLDETNELVFKVLIQGAESPLESVRFICESSDHALMFHGSTTESGEIIVNVPVLKGKLAEGTYKSRLEILIEGRYFAPLEFESTFKESLKVVAESVVVKTTTQTKPKIEVNPQISLISVKTSSTVPKTQTSTLIESKKQTDVVRQKNDITALKTAIRNFIK